ncbi:hypothetical protein AQUCO_03400346v1 [Aquilegia coerulea]|uniref:Uncharacterized protein n=1 Tax=Aquilegia coerulea TaxID=218851 RepID=A0A2G5CYQ4_AQUCA|nr:hypothetical protein AQUCO_03400346v1 [Aquilegia coerulea]
MGKIPLNSKGKKRRREKEEEEEAEENEAEDKRSNHETSSLENNLTFSDTLIALRIMHAQFPKLEKVSIQPFILRSQLYSSVNDRTQVDRDLESLKKEKVLRAFKLNTGQDDDAIMFMEDYLNQIKSVEKRMKEKTKDETAVFDWFKSYVIVSKLDPSIEHQELCSLLSLGGKVKDEHVSLLINAGLLGEGAHVFSKP